MKIITCDLCKRELGRQVDVGNFIGWGSGTKYNPYEIDSGFYAREKTISDICSECFIKIAEAQNKVIEDLLTKPNLK
jgi:hypothetical protein